MSQNQKKYQILIEKISQQSSIDILVNNAGVAHVGNIEMCKKKIWIDIISILKGFLIV